MDLPPLPLVWWIAPIGSFVSLIFAFIFYREVIKQSEGTPAMVWLECLRFV